MHVCVASANLVIIEFIVEIRCVDDSVRTVTVTKRRASRTSLKGLAITLVWGFLSRDNHLRQMSQSV